MATYTMKDFIEKKIAVRVGEKHAKEFLRMCEKHDLKWLICDSATGFVPEKYEDELTIAFNCSRDNYLGYCYEGYYFGRGWKVIDFSKIADDLPPRYQIIIECDGDITTAKMTINGKETKVSEAKRNPADKFDWKKGAALAFERLWDKTPAKKEGVFNVGDRVVCINADCGNYNVVGKHGRVVRGNNDRCLVAVEFDEDMDCAHDCHGLAKENRGWFVNPENLLHESSAPKAKKVKEVKRQAHVGEWVKIVEPDGCPGELYKEGDVLKVVGLSPIGNALLSCGGDIAGEYEYVVLEGYEPGMEV